MPSIDLSPPFPLPSFAAARASAKRRDSRSVHPHAAVPAFRATRRGNRTTTHPRSAAPALPRTSRFFSALLAAFLLVGGFVAALTSAAPAAAHDELVGTAPSAGQRLDTAPEQLELSFSSALMDVGNQILVLDADGQDWAQTEPRLERETLIQPLPDDLPEGEYSVRWRAVSSDGHPITGQFEFLVGADAVAGSAAAAVPATGSGATGPDAGTASGAPADDAESSSSATGDTLPAWLLPGIGGALAGALIYGGYAMYSRRKQRATD